MAATTAGNVTQGGINVITDPDVSAVSMRFTQGGFQIVHRDDPDHRFTQAGWQVVVSESAAVPQSIPWTTTIDGHDLVFYQLPEETLVYDFATEEWYVWASASASLWTVQLGLTWNADIGSILSTLSPTNGKKLIPTVCGDKTTGALFFLDPTKTEDDNNTDGLTTVPFQRLAHGLITMRGHDRKSCYGVQLTGSLGKMTDATDVTVTLYTSDDAGDTYDNQGTYTITTTQLADRLEWRSLGAMTTPGRIFRIEDFGALYRLDGMDWEDGSYQ